MILMDKSPLISLKCHEEKNQNDVTKPHIKKKKHPPANPELKSSVIKK